MVWYYLLLELTMWLSKYFIKYRTFLPSFWLSTKTMCWFGGWKLSSSANKCRLAWSFSIFCYKKLHFTSITFSGSTAVHWKSLSNDKKYLEGLTYQPSCYRNIISWVGSDILHLCQLATTVQNSKPDHLIQYSIL